MGKKMIPNPGDDRWAPSQEMLAAFADGELDAQGASQVLQHKIEAWLAEHPVALAEVEAQRQLTEWCRATAPADPGDAAWEATASKLKQVPLSLPVRSRGGARLAWLAVLGTTAAAVLWLASDLSPLSRHELPSTPPDLEPFPVAIAAEVEIQSVRGDDVASVVVGELPVQGALVLLEPGEVTLTSVEPTRDNMVPEVRTGNAIPLIWAPVDAERADPEESNQG
jgi:hypothetical protein